MPGVRKEILLDGTWKIAFDTKDSGKDQEWFKAFPLKQSEDITVPSIWDEIKPEHDGVAWYYRTITIDKEWLTKKVVIEFGAVHYYCDIWVNGVYITSHEGGYTPIEADISQAVIEGTENTVVVRVVEPPKNREVQGFRAGLPLDQTDLPDWKAGWYYTFGGIWQSTKLIVKEHTYISDYYVLANDYKKGIAKIDVTVTGKAQGVALEAVITPKGSSQQVGSVTAAIAAADKKVSVDVPVADHHLWDIDSPYLYTLTLTLKKDATILDSVTWQFGFREFTVKDNRFILNGKRVVLKGVLDQGIYGKTLVYPATVAAARNEITLLKNAGFNMMRLHIKPTPREVLDAADEMGILCLAEPQTGWINNSEHTIRRCEGSVDQLVKRDKNRTCIIMWCMFNEIGHAAYVRFGGDLKKLISSCHNIIHSMDASRIIMDNSGVSYGGAHFYMPYEDVSREWAEDHIYINPPMNTLPSEENNPDNPYFPRIKNAGKDGDLLFFCSEFGVGAQPDYDLLMRGFSADDKQRKVKDYVQWKEYEDSLKEGLEKYGPAGDLGTVKGFSEGSQDVAYYANNDSVRAFRTSPRNAGYIITQWADAASENAGIVDIWRNPKKSYFGFQDFNKVPHIFISTPQKNYYTGDVIVSTVDLSNENNIGPAYTVRITCTGAENATVFEQSIAVKATDWIQKITDLAIPVNFDKGTYKLTVQLISDGTVQSEDYSNIYVFDKKDLTAERSIALLDPNNILGPILDKMGITYRNFHNHTYEENTTVFVVLESYEDYCRNWHELRLLKQYVEAGTMTAVVMEGSTPNLAKLLLPDVVTLEFINRSYRGCQIWFDTHPLLAGLQQGTMITDQYTTVAPQFNHRMKTIKKLGGETVVGIGTHYQMGNPNTFYWGSILETIPMGKGSLVLSQLRIHKNMGTDPVADRLFYNLVNYK